MKQILLFISFIILIVACKKNDDENKTSSSPSTQSSTGTFSAYVNGTYTSADSARGYLSIDTSLGFPLRIFLIMGYCPGRDVIPGFGDTINSYNLTALSYDSIAVGAQMDYQPLNDTINDFIYTTATFKITSVDTVNKKVSGEFSGTVVGDVSGDTVVITNGTFADVKYERLW